MSLDNTHQEAADNRHRKGLVHTLPHSSVPPHVAQYRSARVAGPERFLAAFRGWQEADANLDANTEWRIQLTQGKSSCIEAATFWYSTTQ
ncbi:hypothetical protein ACIQAL_31265 [Pseudomonas sp. NPDC088368]|uniref:hypothetical protein n=1 Tax=Pseudomonas sp. NPDC088368 TaxID=3364453 RepID=UPI003803C063